MKDLVRNQEWEQMLREHPELAQDLEAFFHDEQGVVAAVGFYAVLRMRLWRLLASRPSAHSDKPAARPDDGLPPQAAG